MQICLVWKSASLILMASDNSDVTLSCCGTRMEAQQQQQDQFQQHQQQFMMQSNPDQMYNNVNDPTGQQQQQMMMMTPPGMMPQGVEPGAPDPNIYGPFYTKPIPPNVLSITVNKSDTFRVSDFGCLAACEHFPIPHKSGTVI